MIIALVFLGGSCVSKRRHSPETLDFVFAGADVLQLRFTDHQAVMLTLSLSLSQTDCSTYPFGSLPFNLTVQYVDPETSRDDLERVVSEAVSGVSPGFNRMERTCKIVAELIRGSRYPE